MRIEFPELRKPIFVQAMAHNPKKILIEDSAAGTSLIQQLRKDRLADIPKPTPVKPQGDKVAPMSTQTAKIEGGHVYLPRTAPWLEEFRTKILAFPYGKHDDQVDSVSQFLNWVNQRRRTWVTIQP